MPPSSAGSWTCPSSPHSLHFPCLLTISPCSVFPFCYAGPCDKALSVPSSHVCCMNVLDNSLLEHSFPGRQLSQPGFGEISLCFGPDLGPPGGRGKPGAIRLPRQIHGEAWHRQPMSAVWPHLLPACQPSLRPVCMYACVCVCVSCLLTPHWLHKVGLSWHVPVTYLGSSSQLASVLPQVLLIFLLPPNFSWT